jgi:CRP-like cAMP-binding protein
MDKDYELIELDCDDPQWLFAFIGNPLFNQVPIGNLQALFGRIHSQPVKAGDVVIRQGEAGDFYYLIHSGRAEVTRLLPNGQTLRLAELQAGQGFGEEALLSGEPRNATVTLSSDGELMRLAAADFRALLSEPMTRTLTLDEAGEQVRLGGLLFDVRSDEEFRRGSLAGARHMPLFALRLMSRNLDRVKTCLVFCDNGRRAATAAFLLMQRGLDARVLLLEPGQLGTTGVAG